MVETTVGASEPTTPDWARRRSARTGTTTSGSAGRAVGYMVVAMFVTACGADSPSPPADRRVAEFEYPAAPPAPDRPPPRPGAETGLAR